MKMKIAQGMVMFGSLVVAATPAWAHKSPYYGGADVLISSAHGTGVSSYGLSFGNATGFNIYGGYHLPRLGIVRPAIEVGYDHFGTFNLNGLPAGYAGSLSGHDISLSAVFTVPVAARVGLFAQVGAAFWHATATASDSTGSATASKSGTNALFGGGVSYQVTRAIGVRAEYRVTDISDQYGSGSVRSWVLGANYRF